MWGLSEPLAEMCSSRGLWMSCRESTHVQEMSAPFCLFACAFISLEKGVAIFLQILKLLCTH